MDRSYSDYIDIIDEVENIEQVIITDNKIKKMLFLFISAKGFETEFRERINRPNPTNKKRLLKSPSPKGKAVPPAGTNNEPKQGAFNQMMNEPSKGRDNRKQAQSSKPSRQTKQRCEASEQSKPMQTPPNTNTDPQPEDVPTAAKLGLSFSRGRTRCGAVSSHCRYGGAV